MLDTYQVLSLLFLFGGFLIALLTYINRHNRR
ncbi:putative holin-like toxin [Enterocloster bolteae]